MLARAYDRVLAPSFDEAELCTPDELLGAVAAGSPALVALAADEPVGVALGERYADGRVLLLAYLAVAPDGRATGVGGLLLDRLLAEWPRESAADVVLAEVEDPGRHSDRGFGDPGRRLDFYRRHGARVLPMRHVQPSLRPGLPRVRDLLLLAWSDADEISAALVRQFLDEYYEACEGVPGILDSERAALRAQVSGSGPVRLEPLDGRAPPPTGPRAVVEREAPVLDVLARALAATDAAAWSAFDRAWAALGEPGAADATAEATRTALVARLLAELRSGDALADATAAPDERFLPDGDRWAGWWVDDQPGWPRAWTPPREAVMAALRDLPLGLRLVLLLSDVARLPADAVTRLAGTEPDRTTTLLRRARTEYVRHLQARVSSQ